jgi:hypothetical protein
MPTRQHPRGRDRTGERSHSGGCASKSRCTREELMALTVETSTVCAGRPPAKARIGDGTPLSFLDVDCMERR